MSGRRPRLIRLGTASDDVVDSRSTHAAWLLPQTKDAARRIAGYVAFWKGVTVEA